MTTDLPPAVVKAQRGAPLASHRPPAPTRAPRRAAAAHLSVVPDPGGLPTELEEAERLQIVDAFVELLEGLYTHLPLKRARYSIDPVQRLRLLRQRVATVDDAELHAEIAATMTSLRDAHSRYVGPTSLEGRVAALPFLVEAYGPPGGRRYIVSKIAKSARPFSDTHFQAGVELEHWNAVPIDRAVELHAEHETGGRPSARRSRALESLTFRGLQYLPPPDEDWVVIGYRDRHGKRREVRFDWRVVTPDRAATAVTTDTLVRRAIAADPAAEMARRVKKLLFAPELWASERRPRPASRTVDTVAAAKADEWLPTDFSDVVAAKAVKTKHGRFGYLRLWSFDVEDHVGYVDEVVRLLELLPDRGLIVDLRSNPGGLVWAAERLLQLFTPHPVNPTNFSMVATALTRAMVQATQNDRELEPWRASVADALANGDVYSHAVPLTPAGDEPGQANDLGQRYGGPVVAVVDANTYSSGDLFAAGFVDNNIGSLVGVDDATGGGGANVWEPADVARALAGTDFARLGALPGGVNYTIAVRRATRSGVADGAAIEDVGVRARLYETTKRDLTGGNRGLLDFCGELLRAQPLRRLHVERRAHDLLAVTTAGIDRLDVVVGGRPKESLDVTDGRPVMVSVPLDGVVDLKGFHRGHLVQRRLLRP